VSQPPSNPSQRPSPPPRAWQRMLSGRRLDLLDPSPLDVEIEDIAHGLARVARWNGQTRGTYPFSVAQHCLVVADICRALQPNWPRRWLLAALLHDAPEYVIGDMISPFKSALGFDYKNFEHKLARVIHLRFGLPGELPVEIGIKIKRADRISAYFEAVQLAGFEDAEARKLFGAPRGVSRLTLEPLATSRAKSMFLQRFDELSPDR